MAYDHMSNAKGSRDRQGDFNMQANQVSYARPELDIREGLGRPNSVSCAHMEPLNISRALSPLIENTTESLRN